MATFQELQEKVYRRVIDLPPNVQVEVPDLVNQAYNEAQKRFNWRVMATTEAYITVTGDRLLGLVPANYKTWRGRPYLVEKLGRTRWLDIMTAGGPAHYAFDNDRNGLPRALSTTDPTIDGGTALNIWPLPDGLSDYPDGQYRIFVPYWKFLPVLTAPDAETELTDRLAVFIQNEATARAFELNWDMDKADYWRTLAQSNFLEERRDEKRALAVQQDTFRPHYDVNEPEIWSGSMY